MNDHVENERHSVADSADLVTDPEEEAQREARNGLRQFDLVINLIESWLPGDREFRLRPSMILQLNREALLGINPYAGNYRPGDVDIRGSGHQPPGAHLVAELVEDLCDYVNDNWKSKLAIHLASYVMWRINWIHPFADGNGRTSRALAYLILCIKLGYLLPGAQTIPDQISKNKEPYYDALEAADKAWKNNVTNVSDMENLLGGMLAAQLRDIHRQATGVNS